jgi:integrase
MRTDGHEYPSSRGQDGGHAETAREKRKKKKRRVRSPHPGVKLKRRELASGHVSWRAVFTDPDTKRATYITLDALACPTHEARVAWAKAKAAELARRRMDRAAGKRAPDARAIDKAIDQYLDTAPLKPKTVATYKLAFAKLREWAELEHVASTIDLTPARLASLRDHLVKAPKYGAAKSGRRGAQVKKSARRSPVSVNRELRTLKTLLNAWRQRGLLSQLHRDDISDALAPLQVLREAPEYLAPADLKKLLEAALKHDATTFKATRDEHAGRRRRGTTVRYVPIAPFVAFLLLTGMRRGEALALPWSAVELDALDHTGAEVGEIRLGAAITKTKQARTVGLEVSPALRKVLLAMKKRGGRGAVFGGAEPYTDDVLKAARSRLLATFGAPRFDWQILRSTCATYLTNAPGIFGAATAFMSAKQLGHSVTIAEKHYLGVHRGISRDARTLEAAMQIEAELGQVRERVVLGGSALSVAR